MKVLNVKWYLHLRSSWWWGGGRDSVSHVLHVGFSRCIQWDAVWGTESLLEISLYKGKVDKTRLDKGKNLIPTQGCLYRDSACENGLSVCPQEAEMAGLVYPDRKSVV